MMDTKNEMTHKPESRWGDLTAVVWKDTWDIYLLTCPNHQQKEPSKAKPSSMLFFEVNSMPTWYVNRGDSYLMN
jgi:hypothetical protein